MKERPILFSAPMVRAILEDRKTVTRRVVKPYRKHPIVNLADAEPTLGYSGRHNDPGSWGYEFLDDGAPASLSAWPELCPYGQPGDRLWVRESWQYADWTDDGYPWVRYAADHAKKLHDRSPSEEWSERWTDIWAALSADDNYTIDDTAADHRWRPSIHMPRWASRITLEVTGVRVERLQDISEQDAEREGVERWVVGDDGWRDYMLTPEEEAVASVPPMTAKQSFKTLWESLNGVGSWAANPWVWVIEFQRVEAAS